MHRGNNNSGVNFFLGGGDSSLRAREAAVPAALRRIGALVCNQEDFLTDITEERETGVPIMGLTPHKPALSSPQTRVPFRLGEENVGKAAPDASLYFPSVTRCCLHLRHAHVFHI